MLFNEFADGGGGGVQAPVNAAAPEVPWSEYAAKHADPAKIEAYKDAKTWAEVHDLQSRRLADAQTALRRCMELHSSTTRVFLVMYDDGQLIAPIRSRLRARRFSGSSSSSSISTAATVDDPIEALERDLCVRQATWSGLGHMFAAEH